MKHLGDRLEMEVHGWMTWIGDRVSGSGSHGRLGDEI